MVFVFATRVAAFPEVAISHFFFKVIVIVIYSYGVLFFLFIPGLELILIFFAICILALSSLILLFTLFDDLVF